jgi:hypothetical protein
LLLARQALRHLQTLSVDWAAVAGVREALAAARFPALRLEQLRHAQASGGFPVDDEAVELAFSRHGGTRSWLLFHAGDELKRQVMDRAEKVLIDASPVEQQRVALQLLRELQATSLPGHLAAARMHPSAQLRETAYAQSLSLLEAPERAELAAQALSDRSPKVQRTALAALRKGRVALTVAELVEVVRREPRALRAVLAALAYLQTWVRVPGALQLLAEYATDSNEVAKELGTLELALRRSLYAPSPEQSWALAVEFQEVVHGRDTAHGRLAVESRVWPMPVVAVQEVLQGGLALS